MNMHKPTMYLHIGTHKTGTSSIQMALHTHREELLKAGVLYPQLADAYNHRELAVFLQSPGGEDNLKNWFNGVANKVKNFSINKIIISAEALYFFKISELIRKEGGKSHFIISREYYLDRLRKLKSAIPDGFNIKVIVYLRRQDSFIESAYYQIVKGSGIFTGSIHDAVEDLSVYMDYDFVLNLWAEVFGKENILVRAYEKQQLPNGSVKDFLKITDLPPGLVDNIITTTNNYNLRLSREILDYKLILNRLLEKEDLVRQHQLHYTYLEKLSEQPEYNQYKPDLLTPEEKFKLIDRFSQGNSNVAQNYLGRDNGHLFYETSVATDKGSPYTGLTVDRAVEIGTRLSFMVIDSYEEREKYSSRLSIFSNPDLLDAQRLLNFFPIKILIKIYGKMVNEKAIKVIRSSGLFDKDYYLDHNPDVATSGMDALRHFVYFGWKELRQPNFNFNIAEYIQKNPEIVGSGINPLVHHIGRLKKDDE